MPPSFLGLDIGGANLKAATAAEFAVLRPFVLWRHPEQLADELRAMFKSAPPFDRLAVTMTGELCDCFQTKREGVSAILDAVESAAAAPILVWRADGRFCDADTARAAPLLTAAANWLATATWAGRHAANGAALLLDIGSTTTDIIPLWNGSPCPAGRTDAERLQTRELVYTGVRRTPAYALLGDGVAAELFATAHDVYLRLGCTDEDEGDLDTADGRPATRAAAHARLSRMLGGDPEITPYADTLALANRAYDNQIKLIRSAIAEVAARLPLPVETIITTGSGEFLADELVENEWNVVSLMAILGAPVSVAAAAYAVAVLAGESDAAHP